MVLGSGAMMMNRVDEAFAFTELKFYCGNQLRTNQPMSGGYKL